MEGERAEAAEGNAATEKSATGRFLFPSSCMVAYCIACAEGIHRCVRVALCWPVQKSKVGRGAAKGKTRYSDDGACSPTSSDNINQPLLEQSVFSLWGKAQPFGILFLFYVFGSF